MASYPPASLQNIFNSTSINGQDLAILNLINSKLDNIQTSVDGLSPSVLPDIIQISIDNTSIDYDASINDVIGTLTPVGGSNPVVFSILTDTDNKFQIGGVNFDELQVKNSFNYSISTSHSVEVRAIDIYGKTFDKTITITLTVPAFTSTKCLELNNGVTNEYMINNTGITGSVIDFTSAFSIAYWINCGNNSAFSHFVLGDGTYAKCQVLNNGSGGGDARFFITDNTNQVENLIVSGEPDWSDNTWHHLCFTYSEDGPNIYVDGVAYTNSWFTNPDMTSTLKSADRLLFGSRMPAGTTTTAGKFDSIIMFNTKLNSSEVGELSSSVNFNPWSHSKNANLVTWYKCEGLSEGGLLIDEINGINLNPVNVDNTNFINL
jgi:hypothetical protein